jgi:dihydropteroate synthase
MAVRAGLEMVSQGADWIDVGGESTRPGASAVPAEVELERVLPVIRGLRAETDATLSVDTMKPEVAARALEAGADIINDVAGFRDPNWLPVLRQWNVPLVLVHMKGTPRDMQVDPRYPGGATEEVLGFFKERLEGLSRGGVDSQRIFVDPGIGFGKRMEDNLELIRNISRLKSLGRPVFIGTSRKSFLRRILGKDFQDLDLGTVVVNSFAIQWGADVVRVHNVPYARLLVRLYLAFLRAPARGQISSATFQGENLKGDPGREPEEQANSGGCDGPRLS